MGQPLYCSAADASVWRERGSSPYVWLSSIALLPWLPGFPPRAFPTTIFSLTSPQSISTQSTAALALELFRNPWTPAPSRCRFQKTHVPVRGVYGCSKDCVILTPFRLPQFSCFTLSLKCLSSDSNSCPHVGIGPLLQFPHPLRAGPVLLTLLIPPLPHRVPSSYWVLRGSIRSFPLVRSSCLLSAGVLNALLCLKVYSWWIRGDRCTPRPPTPPSSCSLLIFLMYRKFWYFVSLVIKRIDRFCHVLFWICYQDYPRLRKWALFF